MIKRTILEMMSDSSKNRVNIDLGSKLDNVSDDSSNEAIKRIASKIEEVCDMLFLEAESALKEINEKISEDRSSITGQDVAEALLKVDIALQKSLNDISISKMDLEATELSYNDSYNDFYQKLIEGTVGDRKSFAESKTVKERYLLFVKKSLVSAIDKRQEGIDRIYKSLERWLWKSIQQG